MCMHAAIGDQLSGSVLVAFRPVLNFPWRDELHGTVLVEFPPDAVDPPEADQFIQHIPTSEVFLGHTLLVGNEPHAFRLGVVGEEPLPEFVLR